MTMMIAGWIFIHPMVCCTTTCATFPDMTNGLILIDERQVSEPESNVCNHLQQHLI